jgi:endonuclease YncB( thermonuclease family)
MINLEIVKAGVAWSYVKYAKAPIYLEAQTIAKYKRLGL